MKDLKIVSLSNFELGTSQVQVRNLIALENLLGKAVCRFTYIMHAVYTLLVCFTQFINTVWGAVYKKNISKIVFRCTLVRVVFNASPVENHQFFFLAIFITYVTVVPNHWPC